MTDPATDPLPDATVLAVPGVTALFAPDRLTLARENLAWVPGTEPAARVTVATVGGHPRVRARIAVDADSPAPAVARAAADALLTDVAPDADTVVVVQVAHIG